jgi:hypothetical protein
VSDASPTEKYGGLPVILPKNMWSFRKGWNCARPRLAKPFTQKKLEEAFTNLGCSNDKPGLAPR